MAVPADTLDLILAEVRSLRREVDRLRKDVTRSLYGGSRGKRRTSWSQRARQPSKCGACDHSDALHWHHIVPLGEDGEDVFENVIALCPNCHAAAHAGRIARDTLATLRVQQAPSEAAAIRSLKI